jgi:signal transduction histidine kinase
LALDTEDSLRSELLTDILTVLGNLIDNAVDAAPHGGTVWVTLVDGDTIVLTVEDTGEGVPAELRESIFDVGVTTKSTDSSSRSTSRGIGLALVQRLVEKHHGSIAVSQSDHGGARFTVELDVTKQPVSGGIA